MTVVVEITDKRNIDAHVSNAGGYLWYCSRCRLVVDGDSDQLRTGVREVDHLCSRSGGISSVGVRHRLNDNRMTPADGDVTDSNGYSFSPVVSSHDGILFRLQG
jgi:hypothetical protein